MANLNIQSTLGIAPSKLNKIPEVLVITRGASAELLFSFYKYSYLIDEKNPFKYIDQITFLFKQNDNITYYEMFNTEGKLNSQFAYDEDLLSISLLLSPADTAAFELASELNPMQYEIAIKANTEIVIEQQVDSIIIEPQMPILVVDSLYNQAGLVK